MNKTTQVVAVPDFKAFQKQREAVQRQASAAIAAKLELVKNTLAEIGEISVATGVTVSFYTINEQISSINRESSNWASSSDNC